jgi:hypothetical protein
MKLLKEQLQHELDMSRALKDYKDFRTRTQDKSRFIGDQQQRHEYLQDQNIILSKNH